MWTWLPPQGTNVLSLRSASAATALCLLATLVVIPNANSIAGWARQHLVPAVGMDITAGVVALVVVLPPSMLFAFLFHLLLALWIRLRMLLRKTGSGG
jgi:hypothetical protein